MPDTPRNATPSSIIPKMTALSVAFPMSFESQKTDSNADARVSSKDSPKSKRLPHRHDAGE